MIIQILKFATFLPWFIYYLNVMTYNIKVVEEKHLDKTEYFNYINQNFFNSFNIKELLLFCIFLVFMQHENTVVLEILFSTIYIYLLIDFFHSSKVNHRIIEHKNMIAQAILLSVLIIGFFGFTNHLYTTYILMFTISLIGAFLVYIFGRISKLLIHK